ncbi:hypothetical protein BaRGS_00023853 [Batillaria attramentaria]|uniref:Helitron helicase-like domain-containing protein n=1 Tax=Batillaria attramentaria TaxID=370345 RepID=A0ABD0KCS4_9CAEN
MPLIFLGGYECLNTARYNATDVPSVFRYHNENVFKTIHGFLRRDYTGKTSFRAYKGQHFSFTEPIDCGQNHGVRNRSPVVEKMKPLERPLAPIVLLTANPSLGDRVSEPGH